MATAQPEEVSGKLATPDPVAGRASGAASAEQRNAAPHDVQTLQPTAASRRPDDETPPAKPPRPLSPRQQAEATLREAFPNIDHAVIKAVLTASGGDLEPAFVALLGMSDPSAQEEVPPPQPRRPSAPPVTAPAQPAVTTATTTPRSQLEADELYARQLAEHYRGTAARSRPPAETGRRREVPAPASRRQTDLKPNELYDDDHSFLDDDLPVIKENIRRTFLETQSKVNRWVADLKKKIDGDDSDPSDAAPTQGYGSARSGFGAQRRGDVGRRSGELDRYDADPQVLGDDLAGLDLRDDDEVPPPPPPRRTTRPLANPELFKSTSTPADAGPGGVRKVSFQAPGETGAATAPPPARHTPSPAGGRQSKWEPLRAVEPNPVADDPFSLLDSDDELETKPQEQKKQEQPAASVAAAGPK